MNLENKEPVRVPVTTSLDAEKFYYEQPQQTQKAKHKIYNLHSMANRARHPWRTRIYVSARRGVTKAYRWVKRT